MVSDAHGKIAFVLGGGGNLGACEIGMLRALLERGTVPDVVVGSSVGALNGAAIAADPSLATIERLERAWLDLEQRSIFPDPVLLGAVKLISRRTSLHANHALRRLIERTLLVRRFEDLAVPFQCVAASIERAAEHWFVEGDLVRSILASSAVPGLLPPVEIAGEHFIDGGIVNSIPISRAVELGSVEVYVLQVGRIEQPLSLPKNPWQIAAVSFEIARRHRFARDLATLPEGVVAHVLPTGAAQTSETFSHRLRPGDAQSRIGLAYRATKAFLADIEKR
jgi:NTE family protein